jgi:lipoprotein signal peptidase
MQKGTWYKIYKNDYKFLYSLFPIIVILFSVILNFFLRNFCNYEWSEGKFESCSSILVLNSNPNFAQTPQLFNGVFWFTIFLTVYSSFVNKNKIVLIGSSYGLSNLVEYKLFGNVVDYIPFFGTGYFNFSDFFIYFSLILIFINILKNKLDFFS